MVSNIWIQANVAAFDFINAILFLPKIFLVGFFFVCVEKCALKQFFRLIKTYPASHFQHSMVNSNIGHHPVD